MRRLPAAASIVRRDKARGDLPSQASHGIAEREGCLHSSNELTKKCVGAIQMERLDERNRPAFFEGSYVPNIDGCFGVGACYSSLLSEARITHELATADAAGHRSCRRCRSIALGGTDGICISRNRWLDLAPDHNGDTHASLDALDDRGDVAALPSNRPKQSMGDERSRRPRSIRSPDLGLFYLAFLGFARGIMPMV